MASEQQYTQLIAAFEDGGNNTAAELRALANAFKLDILALQKTGSASVPRFGSGLPANSLGKDYDTYTDNNTGRVYQRLNGSYVFQYIAKGGDGAKPVAGVDYQQPQNGDDGTDGNRIHDKNYAPRASDNASVNGQANLEGDQWFYTISLSSYERYSFISGQWTLVFRKAEGTTVTPPAVTTPDAPTPSFDSQTRILTATHPLGTSELEYNRNGGSWSPYAALSIDDNAHSAGEWKFRVKAATGRNASGTADSPAIAAKQATVYNGSYTARCGVDKQGTGSDVTRTGTGSTQAEADAAARNAAIAALVCTVQVSYDTYVQNQETRQEVTLATNAGNYIEFNKRSGADNSPVTMYLRLNGNIVAQVVFANFYVGAAFRFTIGTQAYTGTFAASSTSNPTTLS